MGRESERQRGRAGRRNRKRVSRKGILTSRKTWHGNTSGKPNYAKASDEFTFWLLLAVMNDLLSLAGESRMSSIRSSVTGSVLQQQVHLIESMRSVFVLQSKVAS